MTSYVEQLIPLRNAMNIDVNNIYKNDFLTAAQKMQQVDLIMTSYYMARNSLRRRFGMEVE
jgi:hypothetical protein